MSIAGKPGAEATQAHQGVGYQTNTMHHEMDNAVGKTKEEADIGAEKGFDKDTAIISTDDSEMQDASAEPQSGKDADPVVLDEMASILMQAAALEAQMKAD